MNGYVEAGYVVVLGTLGTYGSALIAHERAARRRVARRLSIGPGRNNSLVTDAAAPELTGAPAHRSAGDHPTVTRQLDDTGAGTPD